MNSANPNPAFLLLQTETGEALDRLAREELTDESVHAARKSLKKARAALRLLRPLLTDEEYRFHNIALRDAGRFLSPLRDARILLSTLDSFIDERHDEEMALLGIARLRSAIEMRLSNARDEVAHPLARKQCMELIETSRLALSRKQLAEQHAKALQLGLLQVYRRARKAFMAAREIPTQETLHEWRKQTKYLRTAAAALRVGESHGLHRTEKSADDISDWLGDDHDLIVLHEFVNGSVQLSPDTALSLVKHLEDRREKLQRRALAEGEKLFERKPKRFVADVG